MDEPSGNGSGLGMGASCAVSANAPIAGSDATRNAKESVRIVNLATLVCERSVGIAPARPSGNLLVATLLPLFSILQRILVILNRPPRLPAERRRETRPGVPVARSHC